MTGRKSHFWHALAAFPVGFAPSTQVWVQNIKYLEIPSSFGQGWVLELFGKKNKRHGQE
jgi:hypothetical protein